MAFLGRIIAAKQKEISGLRGKTFTMPRRKTKGLFIQALREGKNGRGLSLMAEIKLRSPSAGELCRITDVSRLVEVYDRSRVDAISVVTEQNFFYGGVKLLEQVRIGTKTPLLVKDFILDASQIDLAVSRGADAVLLIARIVSPSVLRKLVCHCLSLGVEPIVEIFDEAEIPSAVRSGTRIIAVNARDLDTFEIDLSRACSVLQGIPPTFFRLAFSGLRSREDLLEAQDSGADGVLVGTVFLTSEDIDAALQGLFTLFQRSPRSGEYTLSRDDEVL